MPRISIGRFLLAESVLRNVAHSGGKYASGIPDVASGLKFGAGGESRMVVAIRTSATSSSRRLKTGAQCGFRGIRRTAMDDTHSQVMVKCRNGEDPVIGSGEP